MKKINIKHWKSNKNICKIFKILKKNNEELRFIGGCVRDLIINKTDSDIDLATTLNPNEVVKLLNQNKIKTITSGIDHGTVIAILNRKKIEITTLREDIKTDGRHAEVSFTKDWIIDSKRRDFTINAISCDWNGQLYDYHNGIADLKKGRLKFIGDPKKRIEEDHLRLLRYFRFYSYYGKEDLNKKDLLICKKFAPYLKKLSAERIYSEFKKILLAPNSHKVLEFMKKNKILKQIVLGDVNLKQLKKIEKINNDKNFLNFTNKFFLILPNNLSKFKKTAVFLKLPKNETNAIEKIFKNNNSYKLSHKKKDLIKSCYIFGKDLLSDLIIINCSKKYMNKKNLNKYLKTIDSLKKIKVPVFTVVGKDILDLGVKTGPEVGKLLTKAENWWINSDFKISKKECMKKIQFFLKK